MKRSRPNPVSDKLRVLNAERKRVMEEHFGPRDEWTCQFPEIDAGFGFGCFGPVNGHEVLKRSRGGSITDVSNIVLACQYHNEWVENHPLEAHALGLADHNWEKSEQFESGGVSE